MPIKAEPGGAAVSPGNGPVPMAIDLQSPAGGGGGGAPGGPEPMAVSPVGPSPAGAAGGGAVVPAAESDPAVLTLLSDHVAWLEGMGACRAAMRNAHGRARAPPSHAAPLDPPTCQRATQGSTAHTTRVCGACCTVF
jgi:hypothetical protein